MQGFTRRLSRVFIATAIVSFTGSLAAEDDSAATAVVISVAEQRMAVLRDGELVKKYPISTSKFGVGDGHGTYKTPLGKLRVCDKIGGDLAPGAVLKSRHATGEILPANSPGRDPIVTRILWLEGLEAQNDNARGRGIYIHGTTEESKIGQPVSYGCIRMRSKDVLEVFDELPLAAPVTVIEAKLPRYAKYNPRKPALIAAAAAAAASKEPAQTAAANIAPARKTPVAPKAERAPVLSLAASANPADPLAKHALQGSILMAGLPDGPKIPSLPPPTEPKDVPRFSPWISQPAQPGALSLRDKASEGATPAAAGIEGAQPNATTDSARRIAFRAGPSGKAHHTP